MNDGQNSSITTRHIVTVAILASLGGSLSTFVGYLGNLINLSLGVPFGAGQFMAGLHVFWLILIRVIVAKRGTGTMGGLLKGLIELFTGSTHGIVIVVVSVVQGFLVDMGAEVAGNPHDSGTASRLVWWLSAGIAAASNVFVLQAFYFSGAHWILLTVIAILAFTSGVIFAGYFAWETLEFLKDSRVLSNSFSSTRPPTVSRRRVTYRNIPAIALVIFITVGSLYYTVAVAQIFSDPYSCNVTGLVENPYTYSPQAFVGQEVTVQAELQGVNIHLDPANYTGILLSTILEAAIPMAETTGVRIMARDGYTILFDLDEVMTDTHLLLTEAEDGLWLIASNYDGALWIRMVTTLEVY
ncbi:MAG: ECF transporter S component [Candidatus Thorarchaeota archaeon]|jgi:energy-coupling factor transport system substrate-specific component|nr:ECF transporter S component [Candidatus Thorarchaeota archaeon]